MKVLWLGKQREDFSGRGIPDLMDSLEEIVEMTLYTPSVKDNINEELNESNYDVIILGPSRSLLDAYEELGKWKIPKVMICSDPQSDAAHHIYWAKHYKVNLMLLLYGSWMDF